VADHYKHIVIVHGIGDQSLNETAVNFINEFCRTLPDRKDCDIKVFNLVSRVADRLEPGETDPAYLVFTIPGHRYFIAFSECYWQPITEKYIKDHDNHLPVPVFTWAHSINNRIRGEKRGNQGLATWREAITNVETILNLLRKLAVISKKAEILHWVLLKFMGDVQMYTEAPGVHAEINIEFNNTLADVAKVREKIHQKEGVRFDTAATYLVCHSEGTVVAWKCLVHAANTNPPPAWLGEVQGLVTMGSPIDKHHLIWPDPNFPQDALTPQQRLIPWWNFWDISDPVGYSLDGLFESETDATNNLFERRFDCGFARYPIPGLAHQGYWKDPEILHRIVQEVMQIDARFEPAQMDVNSRWWGKRWLMDTGDYVIYGILRLATILAALFFLAHLLTPVREWLIPKFADLYGKDFFELNPFPVVSWMNLAFWLAVPALLWKLLWDVVLMGWREKLQWRNLPRRIELWAIVAWVVFIIVPVALSVNLGPGCDGDCFRVMDYLGWATGLAATILIWKLHTALHKGLVQLWRYTQGHTRFDRSKPTQPASRK